MINHSPKLFLAIVLLVLAMVAVGCGGGDDSTAGDGSESADATATAGREGDSPEGDADGGSEEVTTSSLTKAEFIKEADAICDATDKAKLGALGEAAEAVEEQKNLSKAEEEAVVVEAVMPVIRRQAEEIRALGAPSGDESQIEAIVDGIEEAVARTEEDVRNAEAAFASVDKRSKAYGFKVCSEAL